MKDGCHLKPEEAFVKEINLRTSLVSIRGSVLGVFVCEGLISRQSYISSAARCLRQLFILEKWRDLRPISSVCVCGSW